MGGLAYEFKTKKIGYTEERFPFSLRASQRTTENRNITAHRQNLDIGYLCAFCFLKKGVIILKGVVFLRKIVLLLLTLFLLCCTVGCQKTPENNEGGPVELKNDDELVEALRKQLKNALTHYDIAVTSPENQMDDIKNGDQALLVDFRASSIYYVCAYSGSGHDELEEPYCCVEDHVWVKYNNIENVREIYKDKKIAASFQINIASLVRDIISGEEGTVNIENFTQFEAGFENGALANEPSSFDDTFIYINSSDKKNIYHSLSLPNHATRRISCIYLDGKYYVSGFLYHANPGGEVSESDGFANLKMLVGKYYDDIITVMDTETYRITYEDGTICVYGIVEIGDFVNCIGK